MSSLWFAISLPIRISSILSIIENLTFVKSLYSLSLEKRVILTYWLRMILIFSICLINLLYHSLGWFLVVFFVLSRAPVQNMSLWSSKAVFVHLFHSVSDWNNSATRSEIALELNGLSVFAANHSLIILFLTRRLINVLAVSKAKVLFFERL